MTVYDNMAFSLQLKRVPKVSIEQKVRNAASILDITPYLERYPRQLSGGQRQRVAMGRAIVRDPRVFLFDEPLSNLDAKLRVNMRTEIKALHQRLHVTSIYVTHDQIEAMTMADRIVVLNGGKVEQVGPPLELYDRPINVFVASFIGSPAMNMMSGTLQIDANGACVRTDDNTKLPVGGQVDARNGQRVIYGVRPEHLVYCREGGVACTVKLIEPTGSATYVYGDIAGHAICAIFNERHAVAPGGAIRLQPKTSQIHLFDAESNNRIAVHRPTECSKSDTSDDNEPATRPMNLTAADV
jgi:multiple sugar transport system ATP-binding protein